ncbi:MAG: ComF family protein [Flavobacteriaceae bacterium]|nr:MAG: ComF family protein [Flavobacteriaceae bacterium]
MLKKSFIKDLFSLFYPALCPLCEQPLLLGEMVICTVCRHDMPVIYDKNFKKNKIATVFYGKIPIVYATSFLLFQKEGKVKKLIHELKYRGNQSIGIFLGKWFGTLLLHSVIFKDIDIVIPVPLHKKKQRKRGYNQLTTFGESISKILNIPYMEGVLLRSSVSKSQTFKNRFERFSDLTTKFYVSDHTILENKHILLIDDVITTGATLEACCLELQKTPAIKISIITMAATE